MKVSLTWLKKYIHLDESPDEISEMLTTIGLEVEGMEEVEMIKGGLNGVIAGHVKDCGKHPNADKLSICKVDLGTGEDVQIVCGAPNVAAGQKVLVATVGTTLYDKEGAPWKIKKGKIRGEVSEGMICAEDELGLGESHDGILVLDEGIKVGTEASAIFQLESDLVYEIGLTPNRSDATSHIGVAEDLAAYIKINKDRTVELNYPDNSSFQVDNDGQGFKVEIEDAELCPRYSGISINDIEIKESPDWLKKHLLSIGVRPISNIVDITNYILHEYGQPLHAFDADKIPSKVIRIKTLANDTDFLSLDEQTRKLSDQDLMICDGENAPLCIAGVFGGLHSGVTDTTKNIFIESAHFNASAIRKTSTRHLLRTDAAKCFEKGSDPNITVTALKRAAIMIKEMAGGYISSGIVDEYPKEIKPVDIHLRYDKAQELIGNKISREEIQHILRALNMEIHAVDDQGVRVSVPTNKSDVLREVDLIEEILRIYGFNKIETGDKIMSTITYSDASDGASIKSIIRNLLSANGFNEMMNLSLIESGLYKKVMPISEDQLVFINNTSNVHLDIMRPEMMLSGLKSVAHNLNRQQGDVALFELGKRYLKSGEDFDEKEKLVIFMTGKVQDKSWNRSEPQAVDFYQIKETVHAVLSRVGIDGYQISESDLSSLEYGLNYHRGPASIVAFGKVQEDIALAMDIKQDVFYAEFDVALLVKSIKKNLFVNTISKFPSMRRDLALVIDNGVKFEQIKAIVAKADKKLIKDVSLFDVYKNEEQLGKNKKSYALSILFENPEKTLNDKEVDKIIQKIIVQSEKEVGASVRN